MTRTFATIAAIVFAAAAIADEITLEHEIQAGSIHEGNVAMVVYYLDHTDHFEVVATYAEGMSDPNRIRMGLTDGDETTFSLPGIPSHTYTFARMGDTVRVTSQEVGERLAQAN